jgi:hypothetical protein
MPLLTPEILVNTARALGVLIRTLPLGLGAAPKRARNLLAMDQFRWNIGNGGDEGFVVSQNAVMVGPDEVAVQVLGVETPQPMILSFRPDVEVMVPGW